MTARPARLVVLASGDGSNLQAILDACAAGELPARVTHVVSDRPAARALRRAESARGVTAVSCEPGPDEERTAYDERLARVVARANPDWVVLAGWRRLLSMPFLGRFPGRVVNLHPALPGELPGLHAIERAHAEFLAGTRSETGVMVHLVPDEGVDDGPVLATATVPINDGDTVETLAARVHHAEHRLLIDTLRDLCTREEATR
ncbi:MAG: phosphoribosylglycinamide formyltransferase [Acidimicrobiia bacterium]